MGVREEITCQVISALEKGTPPWRAGWQGKGVSRNADSGRAYTGINVFLLDWAAAKASFNDARWATFKQCQKHGWSVRKGAKATKIIKMVEVPRHEEFRDGDDEVGRDDRTRLVLRAYDVFNADQIAGIEPEVRSIRADPVLPIDAAEAVRAGLELDGAEIVHGGRSACCYIPKEDTVYLPNADRFESTEAYYGTLLHECSHATGAQKRLNRLNTFARFGSGEYAREELRAELAAMLLIKTLGVGTLSQQHVENHAAYIGSWLAVLKSDRNEIFAAAADAQRACNWLVENAAQPIVKLDANCARTETGNHLLNDIGYPQSRISSPPLR